MGSIIFLLNRIINVSHSNSFRRIGQLKPLLCINVNNRSITRKICSNDYDECDQIDYDSYARRIENEVFPVLQELLGCSLKQAEEMVKKWPELNSLVAKNANCNIAALEEKGFSVKILSQNPWLIAHEADTLSTKLRMLHQMQFDDVLASIPLLQMSCSKLRQFTVLAKKEFGKVPHGNRIKYASHKLECSLTEMCELFKKHMFLYTVPFDRFSSTMEVLLEGGVSAKYIVQDMWVLRYNTESLAQRLRLAHEAGVRTIKPWMLRSSSKIFKNTLHRVVLHRQLLGDNSVFDYLCNRLQCSRESVHYITSKYPSLRSVHVSKLKDVLDFVYEEGYTPQHVCNVPRILLHSLKTTKERLAELRSLGYNPPTFTILCKCRRDYRQFVASLMNKKSR